MKAAYSIVGYFLISICGSYLWVLQIGNFGKWWGATGVILAIIAAPLISVFPFIFWAKEGSLPIIYALAWILGILGIILLRQRQKH